MHPKTLVWGLLSSLLMFSPSLPGALADYDYADALSKSILFFEQQRLGKLPANQRATWRGDSATNDGESVGRDLTGGYEDAGDNVKFGFPMAFSMSTLAWGVVEYYSQFQKAGQLSWALQAIKWGTDYLIKAHPQPNLFYGQVGEGSNDHACWERPEDMDTSRQAYSIDSSHCGSDLAAETAAAMAAAALAFRPTNSAYSAILISHAKQLFTLANNCRGTYTSSIGVASAFYASYSGYNDELLWAAVWLYRATFETSYLDYCVSNGASLGGTTNSLLEFSWDNKYLGAQLLLSKVLLNGNAPSQYTGTLQAYKQRTDFFMCGVLGGKVHRTPGGMLFVRQWSNLQYVGTASLAVSVYSDALAAASQNLQCDSGSYTPGQMQAFVKRQVDYVLGSNPKGLSYMVGFGSNFPQKVHHRGASLPSIHTHPSKIACQAGFDNYFNSQGSNPNVLVGAIVGGPGYYDEFSDDRQNYNQNEPALYVNAPFVGVFARLAGGFSARTDGNSPPLSPPPPAHRGAPSHPPPPRKRGHHKSPPPPRRRSPSPPAKPIPSGNVVTFQTTLVKSWVQNEKKVSQYKVVARSLVRFSLKNIILVASAFSSNQFWGMSRYGSGFKLNQDLTALQSYSFGYIQAGRPATFRVLAYKKA